VNRRTNRRISAAIATIAIVITTQLAAAQSEPQPPAPANPHATPEARALLRYLDSISGQYTMTGQHNFPNDASRWTDRAYDLTGKYPALFGQDFGFSAGEDKDSIESRPDMIAEVERQYQNGAVIALTWHAVRPTDDEPVTFRDSVQGHLTDFEWHELLTPGTELNRRWCAQVDVIAGYLKQLRDAHVPVLFRPYHEMNGNWFWWGGRPGKDGSAAIYRQLYDRYVNLHHLDNLIWVWNVNTPGGNAGPIADYYPGPQYTDVLTIDVYGEFKPEYHTDMLTLAAGKPIALGEVGSAPAPDILAAQPRWTYFMIWSNIVDSSNTPESLKAIYGAPTSLTRDDPRMSAPMATVRKATINPSPDPQPATAEAIPAVKSLFAKLYAATGQTTLSGQANTPQAPTAATQAVQALTGKRPAIYATELGPTPETAADPAAALHAIVEEVKQQSRNHAVVALTWHAPRPTDDAPAIPAKPATNPPGAPGQLASSAALTDFEWEQLLTPGTDLYNHWAVQVDSLAATLKQLQSASIPILWQPYPDPNGKAFWWAGRKGIHGSAALYRQLFDRLVNHDGIHNLLWVWDAAPPSFGPNSPGALTDFFPGLVYVDALALDAESTTSRFRADTYLARLGVGKLIALNLNQKISPSEYFTQQPNWAWFLASPEAAQAPDQAAPLRNLYTSPRIISLPTQ
jgi:mannan endo-1,4-beta-mannosidase